MKNVVILITSIQPCQIKLDEINPRMQRHDAIYFLHSQMFVVFDFYIKFDHLFYLKKELKL
jgi:hypothetical protein